MRKYDIALLLAQRLGYTRYLEICTTSTGGTFAHVDRQQFAVRERMLYRCPADFADGEPIHYRTAGDSCEELCSQLMRSGKRYDLVFVDPWHLYSNSLQDMVYGLQLLAPHGTLLVHDCSPPRAEISSPEFMPGEWCGVTYATFLDLVLASPHLPYITVDDDYGCGIVSRHPRWTNLFPPPEAEADVARAELAGRWFELDLYDKYPYFAAHRADLLHLMSADNFGRRITAPPPTPTPLRKLRHSARRAWNRLAAAPRQLTHSIAGLIG